MQKGHVLTLIATVCGSIYYVLAKQAMETVQVVQYVYMLFSFSLTFNLLLFFRPKGKIKYHSQTMKTALGFCLLSITGNFLVSESLSLIHPAITVVVQRLQIFFVIILSFFFLNDEINKKIIFGAIIAIIGIVLIQPPLESSLALEKKGILFSLIGAVCFGASQVFIRKNIIEIKPQSVNILRLIMALIVMSFNPYLWDIWRLPTLNEAALIAGSALIGPTTARLLLFHALKTISAAETVLFTMLSPLIVMVIMYGLFGQTLKDYQLIGGGVILFGVFLSLAPFSVIKKTIRI